MHGAQRKHTFFAGVPKRIGHMSMRDQSALLTVAFSLSAASRCLQEQETDGARGDPPAGGRESCTSRTCCARLGACAPLSEPPRLRVSKIRTLMGARLPLAGAVLCGRWIDEGAAAGPQVRRTLPLLPVLAPAAGHRQLWAAAAAVAVGVDAPPLSPFAAHVGGTLEGAVRALRCSSAAASGTADVQRAEMRLCMSGLYSEDQRSASCMSMCVHKRDLAAFASVTMWMCMCAHVLFRR